MKNDVWIFITKNRVKLNQGTFNRILKKMPVGIQSDILKYRRWQDKQATLLGKWLLIQGLRKLQIPSNTINEIVVDDFKRPFFKHYKHRIDFNISHSEEVVVCAMSKNRIGIDVERIREMNIEEYKCVFTPQEFENIKSKNDKEKNDEFFKYWTRKEAIMKADGRGFYLEPVTFEAIKNEVIIEGQQWNLQKVDINHFFEKSANTNTSTQHFQCYLVTKFQEVLIHKYFFNQNDIEKR